MCSFRTLFPPLTFFPITHLQCFFFSFLHLCSRSFSSFAYFYVFFHLVCPPPSLLLPRISRSLTVIFSCLHLYVILSVPFYALVNSIRHCFFISLVFKCPSILFFFFILLQLSSPTSTSSITLFLLSYIFLSLFISHCVSSFTCHRIFPLFF